MVSEVDDLYLLLLKHILEELVHQEGISVKIAFHWLQSVGISYWLTSQIRCLIVDFVERVAGVEEEARLVALATHQIKQGSPVISKRGLHNQFRVLDVGIGGQKDLQASIPEALQGLPELGLLDDESRRVLLHGGEIFTIFTNFMANVIIVVGVLTFSCLEYILRILKVGLILDHTCLHELNAPTYQWNLGTFEESHVSIVGPIWLGSLLC